VAAGEVYRELGEADALADRAIRDGAGARWRFLEHRQEPPLLPPGTGWMQGAAGIAAFLFRLARVMDDGWACQSWTVPTRGGPCQPSCAPSISSSRHWFAAALALGFAAALALGFAAPLAPGRPRWVGHLLPRKRALTLWLV